MAYISIDDLDPFTTIDAAKAAAMIEDAVAQAVLVAPCLSVQTDLDDNQQAAVKSVLRAAILRWNEGGTGAFQQQTAGPFTVMTDTRQTRRSLFWPSEIDQLQGICRTVLGSDSGIFAVDTAPSCSIEHAEVCALFFGATYCSCGAALTLAGPLWELP